MTEHLYTDPIEMPRGSHYGSNYLIFFSRKLGRRVTSYSNLEHDNLIIAEMDAAVEWYCEQPVEASVFYDGKHEHTILDLYLAYTDGRQVMQEVKYDEELNSDTKKGEHDRHQIELQKLWCKQNGFDHVVRTDHEIYLGDAYISNLEYLFGKAGRVEGNADEEAELYLLNYIRSKEIISIGMLYESGRLSASNGMVYLADLFYQGKIAFDGLEHTFIKNNMEVYAL